MRFLVASVGSRGDVQPTLALALGLRARGHEVRVSAPPDFASWAAELGLAFSAAGESIEATLKSNVAVLGANPVLLIRGLRRILAEQLPSWFERVFADAVGMDAIVSAGQIASPSVAEKLGIPCFAVAYSPTLLRSASHAPMLVPWQRMPRWANALAWKVQDGAIDMLLSKPFNEGRARLGLKPVPSVASHLLEGAPYLYAADPVLAPAAPDWPRQVTATGPWFYDDPSSLPAEVEEFLAAGPPPLYVGFGSMITADPARTTRAIVEGLGRGRRLLLSKGWAGLGGGEPGRDTLVVHGPMPHAKLFPRVGAVIHHGGAGTTASALRAGVPQVIVPHIMDQFYYGHRLHALGLAPPPVPVNSLDAARLARAVDEALRLPAAPREAAAARLADGDGVARAIGWLEPACAPQR